VGLFRALEEGEEGSVDGHQFPPLVPEPAQRQPGIFHRFFAGVMSAVVLDAAITKAQCAILPEPMLGTKRLVV
jgi:hypothetical protein